MQQGSSVTLGIAGVPIPGARVEEPVSGFSPRSFFWVLLVLTGTKMQSAYL